MEICPEPFLGYKATEFYSKKEGRWYVLIRKDWKKPTSMSKARYLLCIKEKRILTKNEEADHIDNNRANDAIENLQILSHAENAKKHRRHKNMKKKMVRMKCPCCGKVFEKQRNYSSVARKDREYDSCSKKCGGKLAYLTATGAKFDISDNLIEEFEIDSK
jgi:hypothetical protein